MLSILVRPNLFCWRFPTYCKLLQLSLKSRSHKSKILRQMWWVDILSVTFSFNKKSVSELKSPIVRLQILQQMTSSSTIFCPYYEMITRIMLILSDIMHIIMSILFKHKIIVSPHMVRAECSHDHWLLVQFQLDMHETIHDVHYKYETTSLIVRKQNLTVDFSQELWNSVQNLDSVSLPKVQNFRQCFTER